MSLNNNLPLTHQVLWYAAAMLGRCIYCPLTVDPAEGQGDHVIPAALGIFRGFSQFRMICRGCNNKIGRCEEQILRCGPEAILRRAAPASSPRSRGRNGVAWTGAAGAPAPKFTAEFEDTRLQVFPASDVREATTPEQLAVEMKDGGVAHVLLNPKMTVAGLRSQLLRHPDRQRMLLYCEESRWDFYTGLVSQVFPNSGMHGAGHTEIGVHRRRGSIRTVVTTEYFRAIAKIAFHYYLITNRRALDGSNPSFEPLRQFIMGNGRKEDFFGQVSDCARLPYRNAPGGGCYSPNYWMHTVFADERDGRMVVGVTLFSGPGCVNRTHYVILRHERSTILVKPDLWGHGFVYSGGDGKHCGHCEPIPEGFLLTE